MSAGGKPPALSKSNSTPLATPMKGAKSQDVKEVVAILESALAPGTPAKSDAIDVSSRKTGENAVGTPGAKPVVRFADRTAEIEYAVRKKDPKSNKEYSSYKVVVMGTGDVRSGLGSKPFEYAIYRRYTNFTALRNVVKSYADRLGDKALKAALSKFPKKELYGSTRDAVVANRINGLNAFLHDLHAFSAIHTEVLSALNFFLAPDNELTDNVTEAAYRKAREQGMDLDNETDNEYDLQDAGPPNANAAANGETPESVMPIAYWLFTPWIRQPAAPRIPYGRLSVHVVEARGVLASDYSLFGEASSDPYCELSIGTVVTHERRRTKHIANTLNPVWDEHMSIPVYRPASTLTVKVFDYDKFSKDDHIGEVSVPVDLLKDRREHELWLRLGPDSSIKVLDRAERDKKRGFVHLKLRFTYTALGEFLASCLDPEYPEPLNFTTQLFYYHGMRFSNVIVPVAASFGTIADTLYWVHPLTSIAWYVVCVATVYHPNLFFPVLQLTVVKHIVKQYMIRKAAQAQAPDAVPPEAVPANQGPATPPGAQPGPADEKAETNPNPDMDTGFALTMVGGTMDTLFLVTPGLKETLRGHQNFMAGMADTLEGVFAMFDWSTPEVTRSIMIVLLLGAAVTYFIPYHYLMTFVITLAFYILTPVGSRSILVLSAAAASLGSMFSTPKPPASEPVPPMRVQNRKPSTIAITPQKRAQLAASRSVPNTR